MCEWPNTTRSAPGNQRRTRAVRPRAWPLSWTIASGEAVQVGVRDVRARPTRPRPARRCCRRTAWTGANAAEFVEDGRGGTRRRRAGSRRRPAGARPPAAGSDFQRRGAWVSEMATALMSRHCPVGRRPGRVRDGHRRCAASTPTSRAPGRRRTARRWERRVSCRGKAGDFATAGLGHAWETTVSTQSLLRTELRSYARIPRDRPEGFGRTPPVVLSDTATQHREGTVEGGRARGG